MRRVLRTAVASGLLALTTSVTACSLAHEDDDVTALTDGPAPTVPTLTGFAKPPLPPPSGTLVADLRQSSIDAALGQMQVWVNVDRVRDLDPAAISYRDPRFTAPLPAQNLRVDPSRSERGYPLALPRRPRCDDDADLVGLSGTGRVEVTEAGGHVVRVPVADEADVVARYVTTRCQELRVARVVDLSWADDVPSEGGDAAGVGSVGTLTLLVRPTGAPGRVVIDQVTGSHLLGAATPEGYWEPATTVRGAGPVRRIPLPLTPARCDGHAFSDGGGATAFAVKLHVDGEPAQILLRMSDRGSAAAFAFAERSCGLG